MKLATLQTPTIEQVEHEVGSPLLAAERVQSIKRISTDEIIQLWERCFGLDISSERIAQYESVELLEGAETGIRFFTPRDTNGSSKFYEDFHNHKLAEFPPDYFTHARWEHTLAASRLEPNENVIEIGSGGGGFLGVSVRRPECFWYRDQ